ncbi:carboxyltransferase domain, subdomain A and B domain-containing protein [Sarocladium implicatum]|nr:carboxyltransferase domain, subdomain A and B domain-containing protein [Sarocladium implicatum]
MKLARVLVANRGEIAVRLIRSCQKLGITSIAIYTIEDADSPHVRMADESYRLQQRGSQGYLDIDNIVDICRKQNIQGLIPGYGFLSEDTRFAAALQSAGVLFIGPSTESLSSFGLKHTARELAIAARVPVVPGTAMIDSSDEALKAAEKLGYPIMIKATAGGGGMGLKTCHSASEVTEAVEAVKSRAGTLFRNSGFFVEKYVQNGRHIETQIFGNGLGDVVFLGERECSVQRRHQKVVEECPSPFVIKHPEARNKLKECSVMLAASVRYKSAGTVEFLVDDDTGEIYFLEMNTRLQVEHGITELCYGVDLVEMMLIQADLELSGQQGIPRDELLNYGTDGPVGHSIEARVYAENPVKNYAPEPGLLQHVHFPSRNGVRVDTWIESGTTVSPCFDPMLAKIMVHAETRSDATALMYQVLRQTLIQGPPTNLNFLAAIVDGEDFLSGFTTTTMLDTRFTYRPAAIEILEPGTHTTVQDFPGRTGIPNGVPPSGPMDSISLQVANLLVGNAKGTEALEIALFGPTIKFYSATVISLCGAPFSMTIDGQPAAMWTRHKVEAGSVIKIGEASSGARAYIAIRGGLPSIAAYLGSKSTTPGLGWGGYQGRCLKAGDFMFLDADLSEPPTLSSSSSADSIALPENLIPSFEHSPRLYALPGPWFSEEFVTKKGQEHIFSSSWSYSFNSSRVGIRMTGQPPQWARNDGGEGGSHPSNMVGFGVPLGAVSWAGDTGVITPVDGPNQTGFIITHTIAQCDLWRLGQLRPGSDVSFQAITASQAMDLESRVATYLETVARYISRGPDTSTTAAYRLDWTLPEVDTGDGVLHRRPADASKPELSIRQAGERALLCTIGPGTFSLSGRARIQQLANLFKEGTGVVGFGQTPVAENFSILIHFDPESISTVDAVAKILSLEAGLPSVGETRIPSRLIHLPAMFDPDECREAVNKYMTLQRRLATYLPDNVDFIRRSNGLATKQDVKKAYFETPHIVNAVGWLMGLPILNVLDPRLQLSVPKYNPARVWTNAGALGSGGTCSSIVPNESPGGYMLWGVTLPGCCWDTHERRKGTRAGKPWLFEPFDRVIFHEVERGEFENQVALFQAGMLEIKIEPGFLDMAEYEKMVFDTFDEVRTLRLQQAECTRVELARERELLSQWELEKKAEEAAQALARTVTSSDAFEVSAHHIKVASNMIASVWKILVEVGDVVTSESVLVILEAMKMEVSIRGPPVVAGGLSDKVSQRYTVDAVLKQPGDRVQNGDTLLLLRAA